ncbi:MAG: chitobiase/beta-hexosaminidase C-terminal domain-containing protein [Prevotella sp.]|nr:chitobiase/beta-hexosaminidase C-terminal domain-containing protein [Candidatus Equicola faecalis]
MKKILLFVCAIMISASSFAQDVVLDFTTNEKWGFPEGSSAGQKDEKTFSDGTYSVTLKAETKYYFNKDGYLLIGKTGSTLTLPAFNFAVTKIEVVGNKDASASTKQNIFAIIEGQAIPVSTETTGAKETNTYVIDSKYQAAGTIYQLQVLSAHNTQITKINIYYAGSLSAPTFSVKGGVYYEAQNVELTADAGKIYYSIDGENYNEYKSAITVNQTTTISAYTEKDGKKSAVSSETYQIAKSYASLDDLVKETPTTEGWPVVVPIQNEEIDDFATNAGGNVNGVFLTRKVGEKNLELYANGVPTHWMVGDLLSGTCKGIYKDYNGQAEIALVNWNDITNGTAPTPIGGLETFENGDFETWVNNLPKSWKSACTASSATLEQSTNAHAGSYAVNVKCSTSDNKRLAFKEMKLAAGWYAVKFYAKTNSETQDTSQVRPGYVPVVDGKAGTYNYGKNVTVKNNEWTEVSYTFELTEETIISLVVMNPKTTSDKYTACDVLIDDYSITTTTGIKAINEVQNAKHNATFNIQGIKVNDNYRGFVICHGKKYLKK